MNQQGQLWNEYLESLTVLSRVDAASLAAKKRAAEIATGKVKTAEQERASEEKEFEAARRQIDKTRELLTPLLGAVRASPAPSNLPTMEVLMNDLRTTHRQTQEHVNRVNSLERTKRRLAAKPVSPSNLEPAQQTVESRPALPSWLWLVLLAAVALILLVAALLI